MAAFRPTWFTMCAAILAIDEDAHEIDKLDLVNIGKNGYQNLVCLFPCS